MPHRRTHAVTFAIAAISLVLLATRTSASAGAVTPAGVQVVDDQTGRGVPLVELRTVSGLRFVTDSNGWVAIDDPALIGRRAFLTVSSHGYDFPADGYGSRGKAIDLAAGSTDTLKIKRVNVAERLYRVTGEGIYADSVQLGKPVPVRQPLLNAEVTGQDSVQRVLYGGKIRWFWGDTNRQRYPLGHFGSAGATSELPAAGGLSPDLGIDLTYDRSPDGFSRPAFDAEGKHPIWLDGVVVLKDAGKEHLIGSAAVVAGLGKVVARRLVEFDDATAKFKTLRELPAESRLRPAGPAFRVERDGVNYVYWARPLPDLRVRDDLASVTEPDRYEGFTCLVPGQATVGPDAKVQRDAAGKLVWAWKPKTAPLDLDDWGRLVKRGLVKADEAYFRPRDAGGVPIELHTGSVNWNAFRKKWVMIAVQRGGKSSFLGEVWYGEADAPEGPWDRAVKVVTHDRYSFYNPVHHPMFDADGGRAIYFEGTYTATFSRDGDPTPRYEYNQVMYTLDLADERLRAGK